MKAAILSLLKDDIKFCRIGNTLRGIGWGSADLTTNNFSVICYMLGITATDAICNSYYEAVNKPDATADSIYNNIFSNSKSKSI